MGAGSNPVSDFAWNEIAPLLLTERARERFLAQSLEYLCLRDQEPDRPPPLPFDTDDEFDIRDTDKAPIMLCERYAVLTAVHDAFCHQEQPVDPAPLPQGGKPLTLSSWYDIRTTDKSPIILCEKNKTLRNNVVWQILLSHARNLEAGSLPKLKLYLEALKRDLQEWLAKEKEKQTPGASSDTPVDSRKKSKRSTVRGEARDKIIAALSQHHRYNVDGSCLNQEPIGNNELARLAHVSESTASAFINREFKGHGKYRATCLDHAKLIAALKLLRQEFSPHDLYGRQPPGENEREEDN